MSTKWTFLPCWGKHPHFCLNEYKDKNAFTLITVFFFLCKVTAHQSRLSQNLKCFISATELGWIMQFSEKEGEKRRRKEKKFSFNWTFKGRHHFPRCANWIMNYKIFTICLCSSLEIVPWAFLFYLKEKAPLKAVKVKAAWHINLQEAIETKILKGIKSS